MRVAKRGRASARVVRLAPAPWPFQKAGRKRASSGVTLSARRSWSASLLSVNDRRGNCPQQPACSTSWGYRQKLTMPFVRQEHATDEEELFDIAVAQTKTEIQPHGM